MLHLGHLGDQVGGIDQGLRRIATGDHHVLAAGARSAAGSGAATVAGVPPDTCPGAAAAPGGRIGCPAAGGGA